MSHPQQADCIMKHFGLCFKRMDHPVRWSRFAFFIGLLGLLFMSLAGSSEAFSARLTQPVVEVTVAPGGVTNGTIEVENLGEKPLTLQVYLQDWEYVEGGSGDKFFSAPGTSPWSSSTWISFYPQQLSLPAKGKAAVDYTVRVPMDAPVGGRYAVLFFESVIQEAKPNEQGVSVQYTGRMGSLFEVHVTGTVKREGEIAELAVGEFAEDRPLLLSYRFNNRGNIALRPKAFFNIVDASGRYFGRGEFNPIYTFPGRSGSAKAEWNGSLGPGSYTVLVTVDLGDNQVIVAEAPLKVGQAAAMGKPN